MPPTPRPPRWYAIPVRVLLLTFIGTLISFALSLLFGIIGTIVLSALHHVHPNMTIAYRVVALPTAIVTGFVVFVLALIMEIRHHRQSKTLAAIERMS
jgi:uncharacterized BrkB/YihY/UPF0761 family membrane protein